MAKALVLGAGGQVGFAVANRLLRSGWQVHAAIRGHRPPPAVLVGRATMLDAEGQTLAQILSETGPVDAMIDPHAYDAADAHRLVAESGRFGALVVMSSASVYCDAAGRSLETEEPPEFPQAMAEDHSTVEPGPDTYSSRKMAMEQVLRDSSLAVSILRPCAIHGLLSRHPREWWLVKRALDGRQAIPVAFGGQSRFHTTATTALADLVALCLDRPEQRLLNVADPIAHSVEELAELLAGHLGRPIPLQPFDGPPEEGVGATPWSVPDRLVVDCSAARALGWQPAPYEQTCGALVRWMLAATEAGPWQALFPAFAHYGRDPFDYAAEDRWLASRAQPRG